MELLQINDVIMVSYQRQGNNRNGNPIYIINVFKKYYPCNTHGMTNNTNWVWSNYNYTLFDNKIVLKLDKYGNIKLTSYNIKDTINHLVKSI